MTLNPIEERSETAGIVIDAKTIENVSSAVTNSYFVKTAANIDSH